MRVWRFETSTLAAGAPPPAADESPAAAPLRVGEPDAEGVVEDPDGEFTGREPAEGAPAVGPRIINVGIPGPGGEVAMWRRSWRDKVCL